MSPDREGSHHPGPLAKVRVIDLAVGPLAAMGRLLAELGADVIRVEQPSGAPDRVQGHLVEGVSVDFVALNLGKRGVALDLSCAGDRESFESLLHTADILIETSRPGSSEEALLDVTGICARHPGLVVMSASDFGRGAFSHWQATDPVLHGLSGELSRSGLPGRAPLLPPGTLGSACAAVQGVFGLLSAYVKRLRSGQGDHLDFALMDGAALALDPGFGIGGSATGGVPATELPRGRPDAGHMYPIFPCADGFVRVCMLAPRQWQAVLNWMGRPAEFADPSLNNLSSRFQCKSLLPAIAAHVADKTRVEVEMAGEAMGFPAAGILTPEETKNSEQMQARHAFAQVVIAPGISAPFPNGVLEIDGVRAGIRGPAPGIGQHQGEVLSELGRATPFCAADFHWPDVPNDRALQGLRVLDLGVIIVGAEQGRLLADQGAEVIKVETAAFPDGGRQNLTCFAVSPGFLVGHRNKKGLGLDLRHPEGHALFLKLVRTADVVLSNFKPGTLESLHLDYDTLSAVNPRIIMVDSSAFGPTGPWSRRMGYGPLVRAAAGLTAEWRYPDDSAGFSDAVTVYPDHVAARIGAIGVLALLIRRQRSGSGGCVSSSQAEVMQNHMGTLVAARALASAGHTVENRGLDAPCGVFPCAGDDEWCVVTVRGDADWSKLSSVIDRAELAADGALATQPGRTAQRLRVEDVLRQWLGERSSAEAMHQLQAAGVPAAAMLRVSELSQFDYFQERKLLRPFNCKQLTGAFLVESRPIHSRRLPDPPENSAPVMIGQHTHEVLREWLHLSQQDIEQLFDAKVLEGPRFTAASVA